MGTTVNMRGTAYNIPVTGDRGYGSDATNFLVAIASEIDASSGLTTNQNFTFKVGKVATERTHASLAAALVDASDGDSILIDIGEYESASTITISKRVYIQGMGHGCVLKGLLGLGTNEVISLEADGVVIKDLVLDVGAASCEYMVAQIADQCFVDVEVVGTPSIDYIRHDNSESNLISILRTASNGTIINSGSFKGRIEGDTSNAALSKYLLFGNDGLGLNGDNSAGIRCSSGTMQFKDRAGNWVTISAAVGANVNLSNLGATAINTSLISDADNTDDLGSDAKEWKDIYVHGIKHNDAVDANLTIQNTSLNGSLTLEADGSIFLNSNTSINTNGNQITMDDPFAVISSTGYLKMETSDGTLQLSDGGDDFNVVHSQQIIDYETVGNVGDIGQTFAGSVFGSSETTHTVFDAAMSNGTTLAYYPFAAADLGNDTTGSNDLTIVEAGGGDVASANGICGNGYGVSFTANTGGGVVLAYMESATLLEYGANPGEILVNFWFKSSLASTTEVFYKILDNGMLSAWKLDIYVKTDGRVYVADGLIELVSVKTLTPNVWYMISVAHGLTNGARLWINGDLDNMLLVAEALNFAGGSPCSIGYDQDNGAFTLANMTFRLMSPTDEDIKRLYGVKYPIASHFSNYDFDIYASKTKVGSSNYTQHTFDELCRTSSYIFRRGACYEPTDQVLLKYRRY